jgi:hypothetical protein
VPLFDDHATRQAVRLVSRDWRADADQLWRVAAFFGMLASPEPPAAAAYFLSSGAPFLGLRKLTICQLSSTLQLDALLCQLKPARVPALRSLALAAPMGLQLGNHSPGGGFASLQLPLLQHLQIDDILLTSHGLGELAHLHQLTELSVGLTAPSPQVNFLNQFNPIAVVGVRGVAHLSHLTNLQASELSATWVGSACCSPPAPYTPGGNRITAPGFTVLPTLPLAPAGAGAVAAAGGGPGRPVSVDGADPPLLLCRGQGRSGPLPARPHAPASPSHLSGTQA